MKKEKQGLYNSKVFIIVFEYFEKNGISFNEEYILEKAGIARGMIHDSAYWLTQEQSDLFFEACREYSGDRNLPRNVGRFAAFSVSMGPAKQYVMGLFSIKTAYRNLSRLYRMFSLGAVVTHSSVKERNAEVHVQPAAGVDEKPYQCEMRIGFFEAIGSLFTGHNAIVHHPECIHRGDDKCSYSISWEKSQYNRFLVLRRVSLIVSILVLAVLVVLTSLKIFFYALPVFLMLNMFLSNLLLASSMREQNKRLYAQGIIARNYISEMDDRHRQSLIIKDIGAVSTAVLDVDLLLSSIMEIFKNHAVFDRGMIFLLNNETGSFTCRAGYGFNETEEKMLQGYAFHLESEDIASFADLFFMENQPFVVQNIREIEDLLSGRLREMYDAMGGMSFICLPLYIKNVPSGVLYLGNRYNFHVFTRSEIDFYRGISSQIAVAISNTISVEKLAMNEERLLLAMEATSDAIWDWEVPNEFVYLSPRGYEMMGYKVGEIETTYHKWIEHIHPDDLEYVNVQIREALKSRERAYILEFRCDVSRKKKEYRWFQARSRVVKRDDRGRARRVVGTLVDIHPQRMAERELLRQKIKAEESDRLKTSFLANMSHEIRTPMNAIIGYTELMLQEKLEPLQEEYLNIIHDSGNHLLSLVSDILDLSRIEAGHMEILLEPFDLRGTIKNITSSMKILLLEKAAHVSFVTHFSEDVSPCIIGDELRLQQVMNNLLSNAVKFTSRGEITLSIYLNEGWLEIEVKDTGIGISQQEHERIFKRFHQAEARTNRRYGGTGLGLTITMLLVEMMGGEIRVSSSGIEGEGATFTVTLPYNPIDVIEDRNDVSREEKTGTASSRVLLVEDNPVNQLLTKRILQRKGIFVDIASNGLEAVDILSREKGYDLVIMDLEMPVMDGFEAIRRIRAMGDKMKTVPVIALTAHATSDDMKRCQNAGCNDFVTKPVNLLKISQVINKYI